VVGATKETPETARVVEQAAASFLGAYRDASRTDLVLVVPAFNEEATVASVARSLPADVCGLSTSVLVMDDGSTDRTAAEAGAAGAMVCSLTNNVGQGVALRLGYRLASQRGARFIATADADGQFDPSELPQLLAPIMAGEADFVNGSRRLGRNHQTDPVRRMGVAVFGRLISLLAGQRITDPSNGLRAWRSEVTNTVTLKQAQYQTSELLIRAIAHGFVVKEVPASMYERSSGESKKGRNWRYGARFLGVILTTWWEERARIGGFTLRPRAPGRSRPARRSGPGPGQ
jgi:glycosyltransferase involved in cell wall biosynthesis